MYAVPCRWYWEYQTAINSLVEILFFAIFICTFLRAYYMYTKQALNAHKAFLVLFFITGVVVANVGIAFAFPKGCASEASAGWNNLSGPTSFFTAAACCFGLTWSMWRRSRTWSHYWLLAALVSIGVMSAQLHDREWAIKAGRNLKHPMGVVYATSAVLLCSIACDPARFIGRVQKLKKSWGDCFKAQAPHRAPTSSSTADDDVQLMGLDHEQGGCASTGESEASTSKRWAAIAGYLLLCAPIVIVSAILLHRSHDGVGMESIIGFVLPLCIEFARRRTRYKADQMLEDDEQKYDQIWVDHYEQEASDLKKLEQRTEKGEKYSLLPPEARPFSIIHSVTTFAQEWFPKKKNI